MKYLVNRVCLTLNLLLKKLAYIFYGTDALQVKENAKCKVANYNYMYPILETGML